MSFTADFILLFILVVIPGLLFKRFFFYGEFSKQFTTKESIYKSLFYSIIPGIILQLFAYWFYISVRTCQFTNEDILIVFKELFSPKSEYSECTKLFFSDGFNYFLLHELNVFVLAIFAGHLVARLIRFFKLDIHFKILRFQNQWYYIFSGEIRDFRKFKHLKRIMGESSEGNNEKEQKSLPPYADILVENGGEQVLYTGFIVDYDLNYENLNELDKIYLKGASRYRDFRSGDIESGLEVRGSKTKVSIKGDVFILKADKVLNINLTFIPINKVESEPSVLWSRIKRVIYFLGLYFNLSVLIYFVFINTPWLSKVFPSLNGFVGNANFFSRLLLAFTIIQILTILMPFELVESIKYEEQGDFSEETNSDPDLIDLELLEEGEVIDLSSGFERKVKSYFYSWNDVLLKVLFSVLLIFFSYLVFR